MKKDIMIKTLQSPIVHADIKLKDGNIIRFGRDASIIQYQERHFECVGSMNFYGMQFKYSDVASIEVFA